jgi:hypothetical protein
MAQAIYTTGPVDNLISANDAESVRVRVLNRNLAGNASVTVRFFTASGTRTLIPGGQENLTVSPNSGTNTVAFNTAPAGSFEVVVIINHPTNVNNVLVSVWGFDTTGYLAQFRFAHEEMHRLS